ncbi:MAG: orotidine 5'-phosphate decarboxylase [Bacteroidetes bacterium RBG_13_46_8]|nr:MAG: orotidine 5'-phosphate decarboxylase [Bacteroidetes bacterium RBG_13_46_8]
MTLQAIVEQIRKKRSFLCIGLDSDIGKLPPSLAGKKNCLFDFNRQIIDATQSYAMAYKPNIAFYECLGTEGWNQLEMTVQYIRDRYPELFLIADAKRGDIGNTSKKYAETFFKRFDFDAVTVAPYMGSDSVVPFLEYPGKWVILLALTSNPGAEDFQFITGPDHQPLFERVIKQSLAWGYPENIMYVVGATKASMLVKIREIIPDHFLLIPGIGAQGGDLAEVARYGLNKNCGLIVNSSRAIIFADTTEKFAEVAASRAREVQVQMEALLSASPFIL